MDYAFGKSSMDDPSPSTRMAAWLNWLSPPRDRVLDISSRGATCLIRDVLARHAESTLMELHELKATDNDIARVDAIACRTLASLRLFCLSANKLRTLPVEIGGMTTLTSLRLEQNKLVQLPWQLGELCHLEELWLGWNELEALPESIGGLR